MLGLLFKLVRRLLRDLERGLLQIYLVNHYNIHVYIEREEGGRKSVRHFAEQLEGSGARQRIHPPSQLKKPLDRRPPPENVTVDNLGPAPGIMVEKYNRPLPTLRNTTTESGRYDERPAPPATLNVAQLRHIMLHYQGKADDHNGPMDISQIAERFRLDAIELKKILQSVSLPPEDNSKRKNDQS